MKQIIRFAAVRVYSFVGVCSTSAAELTLAWDPNQEPDLAGYRCYYAIEEKSPVVVDVGLETQATLTDLIPGLTYSFYVTAYNTAGLESAPSATISYTVPFPDELRIATFRRQADGTLSLIASGNPGSIYLLESKDDLRAETWTPVGTVVAAESGFVVVEASDLTRPQRFYRLVEVP